MAAEMRSTLAVLGSPIAHSRSPALHAAAYEVLGLDWEYGRIECREDGLAGLLAGCGPEWLGFSLTMPLKRVAFELSAWQDDVARATGAVNTLRRDPAAPERWLGWNTDVGGLVRALRENGLDAAREVVVLGGGATATSAVCALAELEAQRVTLLVREPSRAAEPLRVAQAAGLDAGLASLTELDAVAERAGLVLSTLPGAAATAVSASAATRAAVPLFDVAYDPWPSPLALSWAAAGGRAVSGLPMLVHQALLQLRIFLHADAQEPLAEEQAVLAAMTAAVAAA